MRRDGTVRSAVGGFYEVELDDGSVVRAVLRSRLKRQARTGDRVVVGDRVEVEVQADGSNSIEAVAPRRSELARMAPGSRGRRAKVIVANADQVVALFSAAMPKPRFRMLDRILVLAEANGLAAAVVVNKLDLVEADAVRRDFRSYEAAGYPVVLTSAVTASGLADLRRLLEGRLSVLAGPSGAGKSTLLNALEPGLRLRTGEVSVAVAKGRHTTVSAKLVPLRAGGYVADTPGLREVGLWGVATEELDRCFPEFRPYLGACRFDRSCEHIHEPDCAILEAVGAGEICAERYSSYRELRRNPGH